jgi:hypothetical protein
MTDWGGETRVFEQITIGLDRLALDFDPADLVIDADRRDGVVAEHGLGKPEKKA